MLLSTEGSGDLFAGICWWSYGLQLKEVRSKEDCKPICCRKTNSRLKMFFIG